MVEADGIAWKMWERDDYPNWSLPALEAAKCAALQNDGAFEDLHFRLFRAFFEQGVNIANPDEIMVLAQQAPLDYDRFVDDFTSGRTRHAIMEEYETSLNDYWVQAIPTVVFNDSERVVGAVPTEEYVKVLEKFGVT